MTEHDARAAVLLNSSAVSLVAAWVPAEDQPRLWMASDSRLSADEHVLLDEGVKIFEVPVVCRLQSASGSFGDVYYASKLGLGCVGGSLIYHQVHAMLLPLLANLVGAGGPPSVADLAEFTAAVGTHYVRSLGARRPAAAHQVQLVIGGFCPTEGELAAFELRPSLDGELIAFAVSRIALDTPYFAGDQLVRARELYERIAAADQAGASASRAPLNVIRELIEADDAPTIGGDVQVGFTVGPAFQRVQTCRPIPGQEPRAAFWLNAICLDELPNPGPCGIGLMGSVSP